MIQLSLEQGCTLRAIARSVQRAPSSVSRELKRNFVGAIRRQRRRSEGVRWLPAGIARRWRSSEPMDGRVRQDAHRDWL